MEREIRTNGFKPGDDVSVWYRGSRRHKWRMERSRVRLLELDRARVVVQLGTEDDRSGATSFGMHGYGRWEREFRKPVLFEVHTERPKMSAAELAYHADADGDLEGYDGA